MMDIYAPLSSSSEILTHLGFFLNYCMRCTLFIIDFLSLCLVMFFILASNKKHYKLLSSSSEILTHFEILFGLLHALYLFIKDFLFRMHSQCFI